MSKLKNSVFMSEKKKTCKAGSIFHLVSSAALNRFKNLSAAVNATRGATRILL